jgi:hypothetical protein
MNFMTDISNSSHVYSQDQNAKLVFKMNYLYKLRSESEDFEYLRRILSLASENGKESLLYFPPANYEYGVELFGEMFVEKIKSNLKSIFAGLEGYKYETIDCTFLLKSIDFADFKTIDETANYDGRIKLTKVFREILEC